MSNIQVALFVSLMYPAYTAYFEKIYLLAEGNKPSLQLWNNGLDRTCRHVLLEKPLKAEPIWNIVSEIEPQRTDQAPLLEGNKNSALEKCCSMPLAR